MSKPTGTSSRFRMRDSETLLAVVVMVATVILVTACSDGDASSDPEDDGDTSGNIGGGDGSGDMSQPGIGDPLEPADPVSCAGAAEPYAIEVTSFGDAVTPVAAGSGFGSALYTHLPVAVAVDGTVYVGLNDEQGAVIVTESGELARVDGARMGGIVSTDDGVAILVFDRVDRLWASVYRFAATGEEIFSTVLFASENLDDEDTKGEAGTSRLGYLSATDELVAYFGHTQMYGDGVRHQGGYLARVDNAGEQDLLSGWYGSHNLDQRLWTDDSRAAMLGLGDAYPVGIFFGWTTASRHRPGVIYQYAAAGNGTTNGQLGGMLDIGDQLVIPFLTNLSISPDLDPGAWPNIDAEISNQIRDGANNQMDMGFLLVSKSGELPDGEDAPTVWVDPDLSDGARLEHLKSVRYGTGELILLMWAEATGTNRNTVRDYYTMVVDLNGYPCQPRTRLADAYRPTSGDDLIASPDGSILWANDEDEGITLIRLTP